MFGVRRKFSIQASRPRNTSHTPVFDTRMPGNTLSTEEVGLIKRWRENEGDDLAPSTIAERLGRDKSTITRHFAMKSSRCVKRGEQKGRRGPTRKLKDCQVEALVPKLEAMIKKANGGQEVTAAMLKKSGRVKVSTKIMRKRLSEQEGVDWYAMRLKPNLTDDDIKDRYRRNMEASRE